MCNTIPEIAKNVGLWILLPLTIAVYAGVVATNFAQFYNVKRDAISAVNRVRISLYSIFYVRNGGVGAPTVEQAKYQAQADGIAILLVSIESFVQLGHLRSAEELQRLSHDICAHLREFDNVGLGAASKEEILDRTAQWLQRANQLKASFVSILSVYRNIE